MMLPILAFTGFAVDLGSWFARASQIQRAADAAALAGVQELPVFANASSAAQATAQRNGFTNGSNGITVSVTNVSDATAKLQVSITDANANQYFTKAFRSSVSIARTGTAQYIKPVSMGSPKNFLGTGRLRMQAASSSASTFQENYWLAASGGCASKENGDRILAQTDANYNSVSNPAANAGWGSCTGGNTVTNTEYDSNGYFYAVEFKQDFTGSVAVELYDPGATCTSNYTTGDGSSTSGDSGSTSAYTMTYRMRSNDSFDPTAATILATSTSMNNCGSSSDAGTAGSNWQPLYTLSNPRKGIYFVQVSTSAGSGSTRHGSNAFAIRARHTASWRACSSDPNETSDIYSANCPQVYGYSNLGVLASISGNAQFYFAQITPDYNNKKMQLSLFDPGEGARAMQILDPNDNPVAFDWEIKCFNNSSAPCTDGSVAPTGGWTGSSSSVTFPTNGVGPGTTTATNALDLWGNESTNTSFCPSYTPCSVNPQPGGFRGSTSKYSDRLVQLTVQLPADIQAAFGGRQWYKIKYYTGRSPTDRTTWSVTVKGAPIRLIPNP